MTRPTFDQYVAMRSGVLLRFAYLLCGDRHLAEDLVQDVLIRAHRRWSAIEADNPDAYLKQALVRAHISWRRRRSASEIASATLPDTPRLDAFDDAHASREELWALLATLPRAQRAVLVLRYFEDLDDNRIAELVGSSPGSVRVQAHRGLHRLRETLAARAEEATVSIQLKENVKQGIAKAAGRRRAKVAGLVGVVILALLAVVIIQLGRDSGPPPVEPSPTPSASPLPTSNLALVPVAEPVGPDFPFAFTWIPPGFGSPHVSRLEPGALMMEYERTAGDNFLWVWVSSGPHDWDWEASETTITVNGVTATLRTVTYNDLDMFPCIGITWPQGGQWVAVQTCGEQRHDDDLTVEDMRHFAESITAGTTASNPGHSKLASILFPAGYEVDTWHDTSATASPTAAASRSIGQITVILSILSPPTPTDDTTLRVDGHPARAVHRAYGGEWLTVYLPDGWEIQVSSDSGTLGDHIAIYRGVTFS